MTKKQQKKRQSYSKSENARKLLLASMATATALGVAVVGNVEEAEASTMYYWSKYSNALSWGSPDNWHWGFSYSYNLDLGQRDVGYSNITYIDHGEFKASGAEVHSQDLMYGEFFYQGLGEFARKHVRLGNIVNVYSVHYTQMGSPINVRGELVSSTVQGGPNEFIEGVRNGDGFWYVRGTVVNTPPTNPTLNVPSVQFEHGDQHIIGFNSTDAQGDAITYTLEASYNEGASWNQLYTGTNKTYTYTVPNNQTKVQFRVRASDGKANSAYNTSPSKTIIPVQYYWNKHNAVANPNSSVQTSGVLATATYSGGGQLHIIANALINQYTGNNHHFYKSDIYRSYTLSDNSLNLQYIAQSFDGMNHLLYWYDVNVYVFYFQHNGKTYSITWSVQSGTRENFVASVTLRELSVVTGTTTYSRGSLVQSNLIASVGTYPTNDRHTDGYWYVRGQRTALPDSTPPIIELTEQENYDLTSTIEVMVHDLSPIKKVKFAKGNQSVDYFTSNGQDITTSFTVTENGEYTVFAEDSHGNKSVEVITVTKVNAKPIVSFAETTLPYVVIDEISMVNVQGSANDPDGHDMTVTATHLNATGSASVVNGQFDITLAGTDYTNGFYTDAIQIVANDGFVDGEAYSLENPIIIRVNNATHYNSQLTDHSPDADTLTMSQHEAFYQAYESIFTYENIRTTAALADAQGKIETLKTSVGITESNTLTEWQNRLDLVTATVSTETAENTLAKVDFEQAKTLVDVLVASEDQEALVTRIDELQRYHTANDAIIVMKDDPSTVSWDTINEAQGFINVVENTVNKSNLQKELTAIIKRFMSNIKVITPEDLENFDVENVNPALGDQYDEFLDIFQPPAGDEETWAQDLVDFVNALNKALEDLTPSAVSTLHGQVPAYATTTLQPVTDAVDALLEYRQTFLRDEVRDGNLAMLIQAVSFDLTNDYMNTMISAMQEVIEYNVTHDATEKAEGESAALLLWDGQLKTDMKAYLDNGIPEILIVEDPYEYINDGSFTVIGSIQDSNDSTHEVEVTFDGVTKTTTANGTFSVTFDGLADGIYESDIIIIAKDPLTEKTHTITTKPVITVSNIELFKQFGQALSNDLGQSFEVINSTAITTLKTIFDETTSISIDSSNRKIRDIESAAQTLSGQEEGELETLVKSIFLNIRLDWLINNYKTANVEDFGWAGVVGVNVDNIQDLVSIIDDYVAQFTDGNIVTPGLEDYQEWLTIQDTFDQARTYIDTAETISTSQELSEVIADAEASLAKIPDWISAKQDLRDRLDAIVNYCNTLVIVETAETTYTQRDKDAAQDLVDALPISTAKEALQTRLDIVQMVIDAIVAVELAESTLDEADQLLAQDLVDLLGDDHPMKLALQNRLDAISNINEAITAVEKAETTYTQADKDAAQDLVDSLPESAKKDELQSRMDDVQDVVDAIAAVKQAESSLLVEDILDAQVKVDAITDENPEKAELQNKLDAIEGLRTTIEAVVLAESTNTQSDKDAAQNLVDLLPDGEGKNSLQNRLDEVQKVIDALLAVEVAETTLSDSDQDIAKGLVDAIADSNPIKQELQDRLDSISQLKDAMAAVERAESTLEQSDKDEAQDLVNALPSSPEKDALIDRLEDLQETLDKLYAEDHATKAVEQAESTFSQADKDAALELVETLEEGLVKDALLDRLDELQNILDSIIEIESEVAKAEASKLQEDVDSAQELLDVLAPSEIKTALQDRLDEVTRYIEAEKAVTRAEENHFQRVKDVAQALVDGLRDDPAKQGLQDRLDALQAILDGKVKDLLDDLINNPGDVTPEDLADYTNETVYEELMPDYIDEIEEIGETITKDQVIEVVRLINKLEIAKRSMQASDIQAYETELSLATIPTKSNYPQPAVLSAISKYVQDDNELESVITLIAGELNRSAEEIREEIKALLEGQKKQLTGFYVVTYQTETGEVIESYTFENVAFGPVDVLANVPKGYELVGEEQYSFQLTEENKGYEVIFTIKEADAEEGEYRVKYQLQDGTVISESTLTAPYGELTVVAEVPEGYILADGVSNQQTVQFDEGTPLVITFTIMEPEVAVGNYSVHYVLEDLTLIEEVAFTSKYGDVVVTAILPDGYELVETENSEKSFELNENTDGTVIQFFVSEIDESLEESIENDMNEDGIPGPKVEDDDIEESEEEITPTEPTADDESENEVIEDENPADDSQNNVPVEESTEGSDNTGGNEAESVEELPSNTLGEETAFVHSLMQVASLDNLYLTSTPYVAGVQVVATNEDHGEYLFKTVQALASVKAHLNNPTEESKTEAVAYIASNIYDGAYKKLLLDMLEVDITEVGDDGEPDLTPVHPTPPPVVTKPTPTPTPDPAPEVKEPTEKPEPWTPPVTNPEKPSIEIPVIPDGETEATDGSVDVSDVEGGFEWTITKPTNSSYTLQADGIEITVPLEIDADVWEIKWIHLGDEHYELSVTADGKVITKFDKPIKVSKSHSHAYLLRSLNGAYQAMPYTYNAGNFIFDTKTTGEFFFSNTKVTFNDIDKVYSKDAIEELASRHIVYGTTSESYSPNAKLTRAQFAAMLTRALGLEATGENPFTDTTGKWFEKDVQALYEAGIIRGTSPTTFDPNAYITRQQAASMLEKVLAHTESKVYVARHGAVASIDNTVNPTTNAVASTFEDSHLIADYAKNAVGLLQSLGVFSGKEGNVFDPQGDLTRAQMAKILAGTLNYTEKF